MRSTSSRPCSIDAELVERLARDGPGDAALRAHLCVIAHPAQQAIGDARRAPAALRHFHSPIVFERDGEDLRRAMQNFRQIFRRVELQPVHDAEARPQRRGHQPRARGRSDQRETIQLKWMDSRARALPDDQVDAVILHRRIQNFLDRGQQPVNFVEEKYFALFDRGENRRQVAFAFEHRTGAGLDVHAELAGDDLRQRCLAQSRRPVQQHVIERFATAARRLDGDRNVFLHARLADVIGKRLGRTLASRRASSSYARPDTTRSGCCAIRLISRPAARAFLQRPA